ncbi:FmdB family transcriptional regulator [Tessaracoccus rhinocerotis]|uniref:FmdB family transcriptional regulator n=1 Tax=Tessaracoccus rhinocerotis TaxID=1689449 RepID=A0A553K5T3_9ACTN|nr:FmdB family zinc ribbon protein [Tessaracoccus rhinocerotis]TRY20067.1 FmdB family transcriptional regulator [Tessaracoccus rhinocerotis]
MPTYQYRCTACGEDLEIFQKFTDPSLTVCPSCDGELRKVFNAVGVVFKGSGFYATDSRNSKTSTTPAAKSESAAATTSSGDSSAKSSTSSAPAPAPAG